MLEYAVVHELAHLIERHHNERFFAIMDKAHAAMAALSAGTQFRAACK
jgi:predicted metal-dependent hydrolase